MELNSNETYQLHLYPHPIPCQYDHRGKGLCSGAHIWEHLIHKFCFALWLCSGSSLPSHMPTWKVRNRQTDRQTESKARVTTLVSLIHSDRFKVEKQAGQSIPWMRITDWIKSSIKVKNWVKHFFLIFMLNQRSNFFILLLLFFLSNLIKQEQI